MAKEQGLKRMPYYFFYASEELNNARGYTAAQMGVYFALRAQCWIDGCLPNDMKKLLRNCGTGATADDVNLVLEDHFVPVGDWWTCAELDAKREHVLEISEKRSEAGRKANIARWGKTEQGSPQLKAEGECVTNRSQPDPFASPSHHTTTTSQPIASAPIASAPIASAPITPSTHTGGSVKLVDRFTETQTGSPRNGTIGPPSGAHPPTITNGSQPDNSPAARGQGDSIFERDWSKLPYGEAKAPKSAPHLPASRPGDAIDPNSIVFVNRRDRGVGRLLADDYAKLQAKHPCVDVKAIAKDIAWRKHFDSLDEARQHLERTLNDANTNQQEAAA
jgi:hypothetical protein